MKSCKPHKKKHQNAKSIGEKLCFKRLDIFKTYYCLQFFKTFKIRAPDTQNSASFFKWDINGGKLIINFWPLVPKITIMKRNQRKGNTVHKSSNKGEACQLALVRRPLQSWYLLKWVHYRAHISHSKNLENRKPGNFLPNTYPTWVFHRKLHVKLINVLIIQIDGTFFLLIKHFAPFLKGIFSRLKPSTLIFTSIKPVDLQWIPSLAF